MKYRKVVPGDSHTKDGIAIIEQNKVLLSMCDCGSKRVTLRAPWWNQNLLINYLRFKFHVFLFKVLLLHFS